MEKIYIWFSPLESKCSLTRPNQIIVIIIVLTNRGNSNSNKIWNLLPIHREDMLADF